MAKEKLNELKEKVEKLQEELRELTDEELEQIFGGGGAVSPHSMNFTVTNITFVPGF